MRLVSVEQRLLQGARHRPRAERARPIGPEISILEETIFLNDDLPLLGVSAIIGGLDIIDRKAGELPEVFRHSNGRLNRRGQIHQQPRRTIDNKPLQSIGPVIALGVDLAGADFAAVGFAVNVDELVYIGGLLVSDGGGVAVDGHILSAQQARHLAGLIEGALGVVGGPQRAFVDLFVMRFTRLEFVRRNIESDRPRTQTQRIQMGIRTIQSGLETAAGDGYFLQRRHGAPVDHGDARVLRIGIFVWQQRIAHHPVKIAALE